MPKISKIGQLDSGPGSGFMVQVFFPDGVNLNVVLILTSERLRQISSHSKILLTLTGAVREASWSLPIDFKRQGFAMFLKSNVLLSSRTEEF